MYYYPTQPPYFLLLLGFLIAFTSGLALSGTLKVIVRQWTSTPNKSAKSRSTLQKLFVPFLGITIGTGVFLFSGLSIFGFPASLALGVGFPLSLFTSLLVWFQLGSMLDFAERQGMQSLDLDSLS
jgi:uncharacterized membrane protein